MIVSLPRQFYLRLLLLVGIPTTMVLIIRFGLDASDQAIEESLTSSEDLRAWQCSGVTNQNWNDPLWTIPSQHQCRHLIGDNANALPCAFAGFPAFCSLDANRNLVIHSATEHGNDGFSITLYGEGKYDLTHRKITFRYPITPHPGTEQ